VGRAVGGVATALVGDAAHPARLLDLARGLTASGRATAKLVLLPPERRSALHGHPGRGKRVIWTDPIPLPSVKDAAHAAGVTVNDLLLTAVSGALRAHLAREDGHAPDIRAILPYNVRPPDQPLPRELGNKFGLVFLDLPVSVDDPHERLAEVRRRTAAVKRSAEGEVSFQILGLVGHTFRAVERILVDVFAAKGSAVVTNVPGPTRPVYLTGRKVCGTIGWPPESGDITLGVSIISYDGQLVLGLMADTRVVRDAHLILARTVHELDGLLRSCRAEPAVPA
jgi:WS/DGAT/MGAT family acyltransferase